MKKEIHHICITSHSEIMFRSEADMHYAFNCLAAACVRTDSKLLAFSLLTSHMHIAVITDSPDQLVHRFRYRYSCYFNAKYKRNGTLGERKWYDDVFNGPRHIVTGISYILRQGLHHGITSTAFGYEFSSVNAYFSEELRHNRPKALSSFYSHSNTIYASRPIMDSWHFDQNGMLFMEDVIDVKYVQNLYVTPRNFLFQMNRLTDESWTEDQHQEPEFGAPVTLERIEPTVFNIESMLKNEKGRTDFRRITDLELCEIIDRQFVPTDKTIYQLSQASRQRIARGVFQSFGNTRNTIDNKVHTVVSEQQVRRCLLL